MATEIERKFRVDTELWQPSGTGIRLRQGYLSSMKERVVRIRVVGDRAFLTVKGETKGVSRLEFEYAIPLPDAEQMLEICEKPLIEKTRYIESCKGRLWEIDVFHGENEGLIVAEVELASDKEEIVRPSWAREEVSNDPRYFNSSLISNPYRNWR